MGISSDSRVPPLRPTPKVVLFAAYETESGVDETTHWRTHFDFETRLTVPGIDAPVYFDPRRDVLLVVTGIGNVEAAATVSALVAAPDVDCSHSYFLTVGSAGTSPAVETLGSVVVNDHLLDWDQKRRWLPGDDRSDGASIDAFSFKSTEEVCKPCNPALVAAAVEFGSRARLTDDEALGRYRRQYPHRAAQSSPSVSVGASVSGSELWHGRICGDEARRLAERYGAAPYLTTEMEGFGTALALERYGLLDRYLSVRGVSNFDRPYPGQDVETSLEQGELALEACLENAYRVGSAVVSAILEDWEQWREGVPTRFETAPA